MTSTSRRALSPWQKFLAGKTTWQRFIIQLGALAGAIVTITGATFGGWKAITAIVDRGASTTVAAANNELVENGSQEADRLVDVLFERSEQGVPVQLDHTIVFGGIRDNQYSLDHHCNERGGCNTVTLIDYGVVAPPIVGIENSRRFKGCWTLQSEGLGPDTPDLKITLIRRGDTCPA